MARTTAVTVTTAATRLPTTPLVGRKRLLVENRSGGLAAVSYDSTISGADYGNATAMADGARLLFECADVLYATLPAGTGVVVVSELD